MNVVTAAARDARLISKLEDFCSSGEFTSRLSDFARAHAAKFRFDDEEQPLECY